MSAITDWGSALWASLANAVGMFFAFIPRLIGSLVILFIGWLVAKAIEKGIVMLLRRLNFEQLANRTGISRLEQGMNMRIDTSELLGKVAFWFVFLAFLIPATDTLGLPAISGFLGQLIAYIPNIFVAILVIFLGALLAAVMDDVVTAATARANIGNPNIYGNVTRIAIIAFSMLIALQQLQIAPSLINILFTAIVGGLALAIGIAFGLGGRDTAQRLLNRGEANFTGENPVNMSQTQQSAMTSEQMRNREHTQGQTVRESAPQRTQNRQQN